MPTLREPFGIAFLDAMACAVPCVGTRIEAVPEIVGDGDTGLLVPPGDAIALMDSAPEVGKGALPPAWGRNTRGR